MQNGKNDRDQLSQAEEDMLNSLLHTIVDYFKKQTVLSVFLISLFYCIILYSNPGNFKSGLIISFIFIALYYFIIKNFFTSLFLTFTISSFFLFPAKTYTFEYAAAREYIYENLPEGIFENITFTISDMFGLLLIMYFIRERLKQYGNSRRKLLITLLNSPVVTAILIAWYIYFSISLFSSLYYSAFSVFSVNVLAQYGKMVIIYLGIIYIFYKEPHHSKLIYATLLGLLLFQATLGSLQFAQNLTSFGANKQLQNPDTEQSTFFPRDIGGISMHANNHAFAVTILTILTLPFVLKKIKNLWWVISALGGFNIILTQSRTIWISLLAVLLFLLTTHAINIQSIYRLLSVKTRIVTSFVAAISILLIILPRLQVAGLSFTEDGGGTLRLKMLSEGWQILQQVPWTGFGVGTNVRIFLDLIPNGYIYRFPANPHIAYMQLALESGIPATLSFLFPIGLIVTCLSLRRHKSQLRKHIRLSIVCCIIVVLLFFLVQPVYGRREFMYLAIILGLATAELTQKNITI